MTVDEAEVSDVRDFVPRAKYRPRKMAENRTLPASASPQNTRTSYNMNITSLALRQRKKTLPFVKSNTHKKLALRQRKTILALRQRGKTCPSSKGKKPCPSSKEKKLVLRQRKAWQLLWVSGWRSCLPWTHLGVSRSSSCHAPPWNVFLTTVSPSSLRGLKCRAMSASSSSPHLRLMAKRVSSGSTRPRTMICDPGFKPPGTYTMSLAFCKRQTGKQNTYTMSLAFCKRQTGKQVNRTRTPCRWLSASVRQVTR